VVIPKRIREGLGLHPGQKVNVVDSCRWLEYLAAGPNADFFAPALESPEDLVVPTISVYEVFQRVLQQRGESDALQAVALMQQGSVVDLTPPLALEAARTGLALGLPMADSIMLVTAKAFLAPLWTQDSDFEGVEGVRYVAAQSA
jgi:predicted nucleic acid-binding protein